MNGSVDGLLFDIEPKFEPKIQIKEPPHTIKIPKSAVIPAENFDFLFLFKEKIRHHCVLIPDIYSTSNCKLLLEYFSVKYQKSVQEIIAHPDFLLYIKSSGRQVPMKVEDAREILTFAQNTGFSGRKVIVIENIDDATTSALNCILKIIEEPPLNTFFYLIYSDVKKIPETIRSRAIILREKITKEEDFTKLTNFFGEKAPQFQTFMESGYDFHIYHQLLAIKDFSFTQIKKKFGEKLDKNFTAQVQIFLENSLNTLAKKSSTLKSFDKMQAISVVLTRLIFLRKSIEHLNTNEQIALIEIAEKVYKLTSDL